MSNILRLKRGLSLNLVGKITDSAVSPVTVTEVALIPDDFTGLIPKVDVKAGDSVAPGTPLFHDKKFTDICVVSPVAGVVRDVVRGERRKLERIVVTPAPADAAPAQFCKPGASLDAQTLSKAMQLSGVWAMMRQRPYDIVPAADVRPRDIFVTLFDKAPLAPDTDIYLAGKESRLARAVEALARLTDGKVYVCRSADSALGDIPGAVNYVVSGPFPSSNAGVQAANIAPVNKGEVIWTLNVRAMLMLADLVCDGKVNYDTVVAVDGSGVASPRYVEVPMGASIHDILLNNVSDAGRHLRFISGNPLVGVNVGADGYLRYPYMQVSVIPEGDDVAEFMGWASLSPSKMSESRSFTGRLFGRRREYNPDARILGGRRAMIMSGEYDKVLPMDIMAEYLIKAVLSHDIDRMEALGIYEVAPEDFAAAEYVDTSKIPLQQIVRDGLDYLRKELE